MLRPFPMRRLADALYQPIAMGNGIGQLLTDTQIEPPSDVDAYFNRLQQIKDALWATARACEEAMPVIDEIMDESEYQSEQHMQAILALWAGLRG